MKDDKAHPFDLLLDMERRNRQRGEASADAAQSGAAVGRLALRLGTWNLLISMEDVTEIIPMPSVSRVPGVKSWLLGIANLRGTVISIIDLRSFLGSGVSSLTSGSRVIVVSSEDWDYGLLIDEVVGMRHFGSDNRIVNLSAFDVAIRPYLSDAFKGDGKVWLAFDVERLLADPNFLDAAA